MQKEKLISTEQMREHRKAQRVYYNRRTKEEVKENKERRAAMKKAKERIREVKIQYKRELSILNYMLKNDVLYYHHNKSESMRHTIEKTIALLKESYEELKPYLQEVTNPWDFGIKDIHTKYHPYVWNRLGEGNNYLPLCHFENLFNSNTFKSIYDVPLDGTYEFYIYDSGERGLGAFHYITCKRIENKIHIPFVNPGALPQITI
jgi:hypothetical protein